MRQTCLILANDSSAVLHNYTSPRASRSSPEGGRDKWVWRGWGLRQTCLVLTKDSSAVLQILSLEHRDHLLRGEGQLGLEGVGVASDMLDSCQRFVCSPTDTFPRTSRSSPGWARTTSTRSSVRKRYTTSKERRLFSKSAVYLMVKLKTPVPLVRYCIRV